MARMRTLKPEFWDSPSTANASLAARLLFLAMWNWADDSGRGTAGLKELEAFAFPNDDVRTFQRNSAGNSAHVAGSAPEYYGSFAEVCGDVSEAYGVMFYRVKARPYYVIPSFKSHQAKDFRPSSKHPLEHEGEFFDVTSGNAVFHAGTNAEENGNSEPSAHEAGNSAPMAGKKNTVIGEKGKRVIGEQGKTSCSPAPPSSVIEASNRFDEFWTAYPRKVGKQKAVAKYKAAVKRADDEQQIIDGAQRLRDDPNRIDQFTPHPTTWLERDGWNDPSLPQRATTGSEARLQKAAEWIGYDHMPPPEPDWGYGEFSASTRRGQIEG